ncbi:AMP-binding protein [Alphaproteobacteria bacterium]|nr:AMP-binding protein [Alphaproteobacteria bacterium]
MIKENQKYIYNSTIRSVFNKIYKKYPKNIFLKNSLTSRKEKKNTYTYKDVKKLINKNIIFFKTNNFIIGDRIAVMIGNTAEYFILKLSLNYYGLSCVPINMELSTKEIQYILNNSNSKYIICLNQNLNYVKNILIRKMKKKIGLLKFKSDNQLEFLIKGRLSKNINPKKLTAKLESSILYTSGTTGLPKGCILSHEYEINAGYSYASQKGYISFKRGKERLYNCLPVHHVNSGVLSFFAMMITANCQIQSERFSVKSFWLDIDDSKATVFHYLGVMVSLLIRNKNYKFQNKNNLRIGVGAGIDPSLHKKFERKFSVPMIELWGMTEMVRCIYDNEKTRQVGKKCFGKASNSLETKVINKKGEEIFNSQGNFLIRFNKNSPKTGFFTMYNKNKAATKKAWKNGWFNTGDIVIKDRSGNHYFVDRSKNIIRRAGENISSSEVEQAILNLKYIINCCVLPIDHEYYEEEVFAFINVSNKIKKNETTAKNILKDLIRSTSYFKLPCYIKFLNDLPLTSSQKTNRGELKKFMLSLKKNDYYNLEDYKRSLKINKLFI